MLFTFYIEFAKLVVSPNCQASFMSLSANTE
jgi:hypothetical protein